MTWFSRKKHILFITKLLVCLHDLSNILCAFAGHCASIVQIQVIMSNLQSALPLSYVSSRQIFSLPLWVFLTCKILDFVFLLWDWISFSWVNGCFFYIDLHFQSCDRRGLVKVPRLRNYLHEVALKSCYTF